MLEGWEKYTVDEYEIPEGIKVTVIDGQKRFNAARAASVESTMIINMMSGMGFSEPMPNEVGKYQYLYQKNGDIISLMETPDLDWNWETYCLEGSLFDDIEKFDTKEEAEKRVQELMN